MKNAEWPPLAAAMCTAIVFVSERQDDRWQMNRGTRVVRAGEIAERFTQGYLVRPLPRLPPRRVPGPKAPPIVPAHSSWHCFLHHHCLHALLPERCGRRRRGRSALHFAAATGNARIIRILCEAGSEVDLMDKDGANLPGRLAV